MSMILLTFFVTVLVIANFGMFLITCYFSKGNRDTASRIGFGFMKALAISNSLTLWGLLVWVL